MVGPGVISRLTAGSRQWGNHRGEARRLCAVTERSSKGFKTVWPRRALPAVCLIQPLRGGVRVEMGGSEMCLAGTKSWQRDEQ